MCNSSQIACYIRQILGVALQELEANYHTLYLDGVYINSQRRHLSVPSRQCYVLSQQVLALPLRQGSKNCTAVVYECVLSGVAPCICPLLLHRPMGGDNRHSTPW